MSAKEKMQKEKDEDFKKEVMEKDALNRIAWDKSQNPEEFEIHYLDRFSGRLSKAKYTEITIEGDFFSRGDAMIPMHRIRRITRNGEIAWEKRRA